MRKPALRPWAAAVISGMLWPAVPPAAPSDTMLLAQARRALETLAEKQRTAKTFSLKFESVAQGPDGEPLPKTKGSLLSGDSGRFRLEHSQGLVVCDGKTLWQYFPSTRQVIIRNAGDLSGNAAEGVLLRFLAARPLRATKTREGLRVALDPSAAGESLDSLTLVLDAAKPAVRRVQTRQASGGVDYTVKSMKVGARVRPSDFAAPNPSGAETVDMR